MRHINLRRDASSKSAFDYAPARLLLIHDEFTLLSQTWPSSSDSPPTFNRKQHLLYDNYRSHK